MYNIETIEVLFLKIIFASKDMIYPSTNFQSQFSGSVYPEGMVQYSKQSWIQTEKKSTRIEEEHLMFS